MSYKKLLVMVLCLGLIGAVSGCGAQKQEPVETEVSSAGDVSAADTADSTAASEAENTSETADASPAGGTLTFRDVFGKEYQVEINTNAAANPYDPELFKHEGNFVVYEGSDYKCIPGIDVSAYQGEIDWPTVKAQGIEFVIVRLGFRGYGEEGTLVEDERALSNIEAAKAAGLAVGAYFFSQAVNEGEAVEEAEYVIRLLNGAKLELPVVYDVENIRDDVARTDDVDGAQFTKNAAAFCEKIKAAGYETMIYANMLWEANKYDMSALSKYPFWYADYEEVPQTPYRFDFWQYSESGTVEGIDGPVDLDVRMQKR